MNERKIKTICFKAIIFLLWAFSSVNVYAVEGASEVELGNEAYLAGDFNDALNWYEAANQAKPDAYEPVFNLANTYYKLGDYDKAIENYRKVITNGQKEILDSANFNLGNSCYKMGETLKQTSSDAAIKKLEDSIVYWRKVLESDENNIESAKNIELARNLISEIEDQPKQQKNDPNQPQDPNEQQQKKQDSGNNKQDDNDQQQQAGDPNQPQDQKQQQPQEKDSTEDDPGKQDQQQQPKQDQQLREDEQERQNNAKAEEILDKEKQQQEKRQKILLGRRQNVEKDW